MENPVIRKQASPYGKRTNYMKRLAASIMLLATGLLLVTTAACKADPLDTWHLRSSGTSQNICSVTYAAGKFVAVGFGGTILTSSNGVTWTAQSSGTSLGLYSVTYGNGVFVATGQIILSSPDGITWTTRDSGVNYDYEAVAYVNGGFITVGANGAMKVSNNGINWSTRDSGTTATFYGVTYGNGLYVAVGAGGTIRSSPNGSTWTTRTSGTSQDINGVTYGGGLFVVQGNYGVILSSGNGINWTNQTSGTGTGLTTSAYGFNRFVAVGGSGLVLASTNGVNWAAKPAITSSTLIGICAGSDTFVAVGTSGGIIQSEVFPPDGIHPQPQDQTVSASLNAQFTAGTWWAAPNRWQWRKGGVPLSNGGKIGGATTEVLTITNVLKADEGGYSVVLSNALGWVTSRVATLTVRDPAILTQPANQFRNRGDNALFTVVAAGTPPLSYQWRTNSVNLNDGGNVSGALNATLTLNNVQSFNAGNYSVVVSNQYGTATSTVAQLTVDVANLDTDFHSSAGDYVYSMAVQADGKILVGGPFFTLAGQARECLGRVNADGSLDTGFSPAADNSVFSLAVQSDGKILAGGGFTTLGGATRSYIARLNPGGTAESSFNPGANNAVYCLALQTDGKILVGGAFTTLGGQARSCIGRLNANGTLDTTFNPGADNTVYSLAIQADNKIVVGGAFTTLGAQSRSYIGRLNANGTLDTTFNPGANNGVNCVAVQPDGKILVGGWFTFLGGQTRNYIGRLNSSGALDTTFNPGANYAVFSLAVQTDGKILAGGTFTSLAGYYCTYVGRLSSTGAFDSAFNPQPNNYVISLAVQANGKVLVGGGFSTLAGQACSCLGRLNNTGPATQTLTSDGSNIAWMRGATSPEVWRTEFEFSTNGTDWVNLGAGTRTVGGWQRAASPAPTNSFIRGRGFVCGGYDNASSGVVEAFCGPLPLILAQPSSLITNFGATVSFNVSAMSPPPLSYQWLKDGAALVNGGNIWGVQTSSLGLNSVSGTDSGGYSIILSNSWGSLTSSVATLTVLDPAILTPPVGQSGNLGESVTFSVTANGTIPLTYQWRGNGVNLGDGPNVSGATTPTLTLSSLQQSDAGSYDVVVSNPCGSITSSVALLTVNLITADSTFNTYANDTITALAVQPDGKILVGGFFTNLIGQPRDWIGRLNADGTLDSELKILSILNQGPTPMIVGDDYSLPGIGPGNLGPLPPQPPEIPLLPAFVYSLAVQPDRKILVGGCFHPPGYINVAVARLGPTGKLDPGFTPVKAIGGYPFVVMAQADGKVLVGGGFTNLATRTCTGIGRLNADGTFDSGFNAGADGSVYAVVVQSDGKILLGGIFNTLRGAARASLARLNADGSLDDTFNPAADSFVSSILVQPDGKIVVGGGFTSLGGSLRLSGLGRLNADGTVDTTFNPCANGWVSSLLAQADGKILVGGTFTNLAGQPRFGLARLNADGTPDIRFNPGVNGPVYALALQGDGKVLVGGAFSTLGPNGAGHVGIGRLDNIDSATQNLAFDGSTINWLRSGASPEAQRTTFDYSTNGVDWLSLGAGTRTPGGWRLSSGSVTGEGTLRARALVAGGLCNGSSGLVESTLHYVPAVPLVIVVNDGSFGFRTDRFEFNLTGPSGRTVVIEASTDLVNWIGLATNTLSTGPLFFSDGEAANVPQRCYRARFQ
jgi:uncharacterized delta-60 repeat protein